MYKVETMQIAKGSSGGRGGGGRASSSKSSSKGTKTSTSIPQVKKSQPGDKIKSKDGKEIQTSSTKPKDSRYSKAKGIVGDGYSPQFHGYTAPSGSVVYYPAHSAMDYLPWIYLFSQDSPSHDQAVVVEPDGKEITVQPEKGTDGLMIFNWLVLIILCIAIIAGIMWVVYKLTNRSK